MVLWADMGKKPAGPARVFWAHRGEKTYPTGGAWQSGLTEAVRIGSSSSRYRDSPAAAGKRAALWSGVEEGEGGDYVAEKIAGLLVLHLVQTETRGRC
jgi:hypothetical protein